MAQDAVINGTSFPGVESVVLVDAMGKLTQYFSNAGGKVQIKTHEVTFASDLGNGTNTTQTIITGDAFIKAHCSKDTFAVLMYPVTPVAMTAANVVHSIFHCNANIGASDAVRYGFAYKSNSASAMGFDGMTQNVSANNYNACFRAKDTGNLDIYVASSRIIKAGTYKIVLLNWEQPAAPSYTNVLPLAVASDGKSIYNASETPGYKANTRWSASGNAENTATGVYLTGYIPVMKGDVIRLKDIVMPDVDGNSCYIHFFKNNLATASGNSNNSAIRNYANGVWDNSGNLSQFEITADYTHIRIQCGGITGNSVITINEPID